MHLPTLNSGIRPIGVFPSEAPRCPRCGQVIRAIRVPATGSVFTYCGSRAPHRAGMGGGRSRCEQQVYVAGVSRTTCVVMAISRAEWVALQSEDGYVALIEDLALLVDAVSRAQVDEPVGREQAA